MPRCATLGTAATLLIAALPGLIGAQEGYPLDGTWRGEWGGTPAASSDASSDTTADASSGTTADAGTEANADTAGTTRAANHVVLVMMWDGTTINGRINPGPSSIPFASAVLDPGDWSVRIEATARSGEPIVIEGRLQDIGSYNRHIEGTWTQAGTSYPLRIERQ